MARHALILSDFLTGGGRCFEHSRRFVWCLLLCTACYAVPSTGALANDSALPRVSSGLQALYDFHSADSGFIEDLSDHEDHLNLRIADPGAVRQADNGLEIIKPTVLRTEKPAARLVTAIQKSGAVTIEAWIRPSKGNQTGPARLVTLSRDANQRNFTLGQEGDKFEVRLRTTKTSTNGIPAVVSKVKVATSGWTHLVYTCDRTGRVRLYINGKRNLEKAIGGGVSNWDRGFHLALANELSGDRPWLGAYRLVAIYSRDLSPAEIEQNFGAGPELAPPSAEELLARQARANAQRFEMQIAPLLANHCLECHDTVTKNGGLDLSQKMNAFDGGESGPAFVAGKAAESLLWQLVELDEMPLDRQPLTTEEKALLKTWIDEGATWSLDMIDPAIYVHGDRTEKVFLQRLTLPEYIETVRSTVGVDIAKEAREILPSDLRADGFSNTAYNLNVDLGHVEAYARLAEIVVQRIDIRALARKHTRSRELTDENITKVIEPVGRRLLRGPLNSDEIGVYCGISTSVAGAGGDFDEALRYVLEAMLQSPRFIYRIERQHGDGSTRPVGSYELASRLSYILWGGPPDDELLKAAEEEALDASGVEAQVRRMLQDPRAVERSRQFISEWLNLGRLRNLRPSPEKFSEWDPDLAEDMRQETLAFFEEIVWKQDRPLADLLNAQVTFVTPRLARHYGLPLEAASKSDEAIRYDLDSVPQRGGLLTHGSVLTVGGDEASTVTRGLFVMHELLRGVVRDPPPCVDTTPIPSKPGLTQRAIAEMRIANESCTGCHAKFEPLSFGLGKFDGLGSYHEQDEFGNKLRDDGNILFPGQGAAVEYDSSAELMDLLAASDRVRETLTWKVTQFALGRPLGPADARTVADIHRQAREGGGTYASLMMAIATSDLVRMTRTEKE